MKNRLWIGAAFAAALFTLASPEGVTAASVDAQQTQQTAQTQTPAKPNAPYQLAVSDSYGDAYLSWMTDYDNYTVAIYRSVAEGEYRLLDSETCYSNSGYYYDSDVKAGLTYRYRLQITSYQTQLPVTYYEDEEVEGEEGYAGYTYTYSYTEWKTATVSEPGDPVDFPDAYFEALEAPELTTVTALTKHRITVVWKGVGEADGYQIYRKLNSGDYAVVKAVKHTGASEYTYTDKGLAVGDKCTYKVCAYSSDRGNKYEGAFSAKEKAQVTIGATKITKITSPKEATNVIRWKKNDEATGYVLYVAEQYDGSYRKLKTLKGKSKTTYTHRRLTHGQQYNYMVVSYRKTAHGTVKSASVITQGYCGYYGYAEEDYYSRCQRIFGKNYYKAYKTPAEAYSHMTSISVKVWDLSGGKKVTRTRYLTVNKKIAPTVKKMFAEIYRSKERIPIHEMGSYSWRGTSSEHDEGLAIDINSNENYMIDGGKVLAGSFWNPKKSPYSIPLECDMVDIMEKYGYFRGLWGDRKDYMHFSYFGT